MGSLLATPIQTLRTDREAKTANPRIMGKREKKEQTRHGSGTGWGGESKSKGMGTGFESGWVGSWKVSATFPGE